MDKSFDSTNDYLENGSFKLGGDRRKGKPYKLTRNDKQQQAPSAPIETRLHPTPIHPRSPIHIQPASPVILTRYSKEMSSEGTSGSADDTLSPNIRPIKPTKRRLFSRRQLNGLKDSFESNAYPSREEYDSLASSLSMKESSVKQWFQNARAKLRKRGSLSSATKTFYLDRTEPMSPPLITSPEQISPHNSSVTLSHQQKAVAALATSQRAISPPENSQMLRIIAPIPPVIKVEKMVSPSIKLEPVEERELESEDISIEEDNSSLSPLPEQRHAATESSLATYQTMTQVALPSDHPFCNLGQGLNSKRRRRKQSPASVAETTEVRISQPHPNPLPEKRKRSDSGSEERVPKVAPLSVLPPIPSSMPMYLPAHYMQAMQSMQMKYEQVAPVTKSPVNSVAPEGNSQLDNSEDAPLDLSTSKTKRTIATENGNSKSKSPGASSTPPSVPASLIQPMPAYGQSPYMFPMYPLMPMPIGQFPGFTNQMAWAMPKWQPFPSQVNAAK